MKLFIVPKKDEPKKCIRCERLAENQHRPFCEKCHAEVTAKMFHA